MLWRKCYNTQNMWGDTHSDLRVMTSAIWSGREAGFIGRCGNICCFGLPSTQTLCILEEYRNKKGAKSVCVGAGHLSPSFYIQ